MKAVRLYNFDGQAITPDHFTVISYENRTSEGEEYKLIIDSQIFTNYKEARRFIKDNPLGNYKIVGNNPFESCVPLDALELYNVVYSTEAVEKYADILIPQVKIFEYTGMQ